MSDMSGWIEQANCKNMNFLFYPTKRTRKKYLIEAQNLCRTCPVSQQCLEYAEKNEEIYGIWSGQDREADKRKRRLDKIKKSLGSP